MNKKRIFALFIAVFMLLALFSACATDEGGTDDDQSDTSNVDNAGDDANTGDDANSGDNPVETERVALEYLGTYDDEYTIEEIEEGLRDE